MSQDSWLLEVLRCPQTHDLLQQKGDLLIRPDGQSYPIIRGIPSLVFPAASVGEDAKWQRFYDWYAPIYDFNERFLGHILTGLDIPKERVQLISLLGLKRGTSILEVSPGPGVYQKLIRGHIGNQARYAAVDLSMGMLNQCQKRNQELNVALVHANASHLPFADESFDALFHFGGVNLFDEPEGALAEFVRVVRTGGIVSWGDEGSSSSIPDGWKKRFLTRMNPGYLKPRPPIPKGLSNIKQLEVSGGYGYLIIGNKSTS
jgi:ubiquinone/menaquinone biosynthesis C-methylase UbiE